MYRTHLLSVALILALTSCGESNDSSSSSSSASSSNSSSSSSSSTSTGASVPSSAASVYDASNARAAEPLADVTIAFSTDAAGVKKDIPLWGLDTAWVSEDNIRRGRAFMGANNVDVVRVSFTPTAALVNGQLQTEQSNLLNQRISYVDLIGANTPVVLNADPPTVDPWFVDVNGDTNAAHWAQLMEVTAQRCEDRGHQVLAAGPFNEPDYSTHQGSMQNFYDIVGALGQYSRFDNIRITGGNTLSADQAGPWYDFLKDRLDEGNTHQLNGSFDSYASFFQTVTGNGDRAVNDELHNVVEALIGVEYGMKTGIWWGTAERARGEFVKTSEGVRLGYAEHRDHWTAAAVYRGPDGRVQAFAGGSERQATDTNYRVVLKDRAVYFDGHGPQHDYTMVVPGGTGYWENQPNAEQVVNITWGEDIQQAVHGRYVLVNRNSSKVLEVADSNTANGADLIQGDYSGNSHQQWNFEPLDPSNGQDFSYFKMTAAHSGKAPDVVDFGLGNGVKVAQWEYLNGSNQHWYLDYAGDGWFYVCSRWSAKCLEVDAASTSAGATIQQWQNEGQEHQQWRLLPMGAPIEFDAPDAPSGLSAYANPQSVYLRWNGSRANDVAGYTVLRATSANGSYETIARDVTATDYVDNSVLVDKTYYYKVRAEDQSLNRSAYSNQASAAASGDHSLVTQLRFDSDLGDYSANRYHGLVGGDLSYDSGKIGSAVVLNGTDNYVQLPAYIVNNDEITISTWVYWNGGNVWQRIFDFGNDQKENMFLTAAADSGNLRFAINAGDGEQTLESSPLTTGQWVHLAVVLDSGGGRLYVNGAIAVQSSSVTLKPSDFKPVMNYIGRSQFPDPLFSGRIDEFRIYNYALTTSEVAALANP